MESDDEFYSADSSQAEKSSIEVTSFNISRNTPIREKPKPTMMRSNSFHPQRNVQAIFDRMRPFLSNENLSESNESIRNISPFTEPTRRLNSTFMSMPMVDVTCQRCNRTVYEAEKIVAAGKTWHKSCFKCAACGRLLALGKSCDRNGEILCNVCYSKHFGPKGIRGAAIRSE
ncbi:LIM domain-containing protein [Ditylenchus destructor]|uniref:LIM domain-containing protein n=1 Tax=Ditylenchus destructor TaxID=166010 RepID=A0AAD4R5U4_9BILA|nr:LIM domain-containing protein [Ditylenchus destructor]